MGKIINIAVFASGNGSNFEALVKAEKRKLFNGKIKLLIVDKEDAFAVKRAQKYGIKAVFVNPKKYSTRHRFEKRIIDVLKEEKIDLIALAGFMRILTLHFVKKYKGKIINIHPAILPSFKGAAAIKDAFEYGVKVTGVTIHFVDEKIDHGPIILQKAVDIKPKETLKSLEKRIHAIEHKLYPQAVKLFCENKLSIKKRIVVLKK